MRISCARSGAGWGGPVSVSKSVTLTIGTNDLKKPKIPLYSMKPRQLDLLFEVKEFVQLGVPKIIGFHNVRGDFLEIAGSLRPYVLLCEMEAKSIIFAKRWISFTKRYNSCFKLKIQIDSGAKVREWLPKVLKCHYTLWRTRVVA